jgi:hypothetical protein
VLGVKDDEEQQMSIMQRVEKAICKPRSKNDDQ